MNNLPTWKNIKWELQTALALQADALMLARGGEKGKILAEEFLDVKLNDFLFSDELSNDDFRESINLLQFQIYEVAKNSYDYCKSKNFCSWGGYDIETMEDVLDIFIGSIPRVAIGGSEWDVGGYLMFIHKVLVERMHFHEDVLRETSFYNNEYSIPQLAILAQMTETSVRNMAGPSNERPLKTEFVAGESSSTNMGEKRQNSMKVKGLNALEWLVGRRGFSPGKISPKNFNLGLSEYINRGGVFEFPSQSIGSGIGVLAWLNVGSTEKILTLLDWEKEEFLCWVNGDFCVDKEKIQSLEKLLEINSGSLLAAIERAKTEQ